MLFDIYRNKSVLITGDTGFKGSWLSMWLKKLGSDIYGFSLNLPSAPSNYEACNLSDFVKTTFADIRDLEELKRVMREIRPQFIFHLAAQSLVKKSYLSPLDTLTVNAIGSANVIEAARTLDNEVTIVMITSDKAYDNVEWKWGYRENDRIGGKDPYSASKGMAELAIRSYFASFIESEHSNVNLGITRAGNVIGGGDWALDRIIPDCVKSWSSNRPVEVRNPNATRPWQHVLEPLSGYLSLGAHLADSKKFSGEAYNFGPSANQNHSVSELILEMKKHWKNVDWSDRSSGNEIHSEAGLLKLNCDKALFDLHWNPALNFEETVRFTVEWYKKFYDITDDSMFDFCIGQIEEYSEIALKKRIKWATND